MPRNVLATTSLVRRVSVVEVMLAIHLAVVVPAVLVTSLKHFLVGVRRSAAVGSDNNRAHLVDKT